MKADRTEGGEEGEDRTRDEEPGREMEGDTVMTMNTRDNSNPRGTDFIQKN